MAKESGVLGKLLQLARPSAAGADCCGVEIVEDTEDTDDTAESHCEGAESHCEGAGDDRRG